MNQASCLPHDWHPQPLPGNVELGAGTWLYSSFAFLHCRSKRACAVKVGSHTGIYNGSFFELGPDGEVSIGDFCTLVGAIIATNGTVRIGDYSFIAHEVVIADGNFARPHRPAVHELAGQTEPALSVELGKDVWVGAGVVLLKGARIGDGAIIGAASVVDFEVPAYAIVGGNPARIVGKGQPPSVTSAGPPV